MVKAKKSTKKSTKESPKKKTGGKTAKKPPKKKTVKKDRSIAKVPAGERRVVLVKTMQRIGAKNGEAKPVSILAEKTGYTPFDVYGLISGTSGKAGASPNCLVAHGMVKPVDVEGVRGFSYTLTAKGAKADFSKPPFAGKKK